MKAKSNEQKIILRKKRKQNQIVSKSPDGKLHFNNLNNSTTAASVIKYTYNHTNTNIYT